MQHLRKPILVIGIITISIISTAYNIAGNNRYKNLRVLPKDISEKKLDSMMLAYNKALAVTCDFCHVKPKANIFALKVSGSDTLDYALDNPMKEEARKMIRLQAEINKNYFNSDTSIRAEYLNVVGCNTCHRGTPFPAWE